MKVDLVCEGGGVKIPALCGAYEAIVEKGFTPSHCAGTSAGAITASVIAAGYTPAEVKKIIMDADFKQFTDGSKTLAGKIWSLIRHNGVYKGDAFYHYMKDILAAKNIHTFKDLRYADTTHKRYDYKLRVMASDITASCLVDLPGDIVDYGMDPDDLEVALAVRMSMSIPFFFRPIIIDPKTEGYDVKHSIVDGGVLSNFPIWCFDNEDEPDHPTFGLLLHADKEDKPRKTSNPINQAAALFNCMLSAQDKRFVRPDDFTNRTISIPTGNVSSIDFGLTNQRKAILYKHGMEAASEFLKDWNWNRYRRWAINSRSKNL